MNPLRLIGGFARGILGRRGLLPRLLALLALLPVFAEPRQPLAGASWHYLIVIDVSESMNVRDTEGSGSSSSRLEHAKRVTLAALRELPCGSQAAIGLFAGTETVTLFEPLEVCRHYPAIDQVVRSIDWRMAWVGDSRIERGLAHAIGEAVERKLDLMFITDGDETPRVAAPRLTALHGLRGKVKGWVVGIGGEQPRPVPRLDAEDEVIGYWSAVDAVREGFHPNAAAAVSGLEAGATLAEGTLDGVEEHESAMRGTHLATLARAAGLEFLHAERGTGAATVVSDRTLARHQVVERDVRFAFALASAALLAFAWIRDERG